MDTLGERLRLARSAKGISQLAVARALDTSRTVVSKWENNEQEPRLQTLQRLAALYGVRLEDLVTSEANPSPVPHSDGLVAAEGPTERLMRLAEDLSTALKMREENERLRIEQVEAPRAEAEKIAREAERASREADRAAREGEKIAQENLRMLMMQLMGTPRDSGQPGGGEPVDVGDDTGEEPGSVDAARG